MFSEIAFVCLGSGYEKGTFERLYFSFYSEFSAVFLSQLYICIVVHQVGWCLSFFFASRAKLTNTLVRMWLTVLHERKPPLSHEYIPYLGQRVFTH